MHIKRRWCSDIYKGHPHINHKAIDKIRSHEFNTRGRDQWTLYRESYCEGVDPYMSRPQVPMHFFIGGWFNMVWLYAVLAIGMRSDVANDARQNNALYLFMLYKCILMLFIAYFASISHVKHETVLYSQARMTTVWDRRKCWDILI